jgi:carbohydrate kinase (thermoresistant glucokinase family)
VPDKVHSGAQQNAAARAPIILVMGVSGAGKSTVAEQLAQRFNCAFADGDEFHSASNIAKMRAGTPLTDGDRQSWLEAIAARVNEWRAGGVGGIVACSALKRAYRRIIIGTGGSADKPDVTLVYLRGDPPLIRRRLNERQHHFMPASLLDSQFATLEEPGADEHPIVLDAAKSAPELVAEVWRRLHGDVAKDRRA